MQIRLDIGPVRPGLAPVRRLLEAASLGISRAVIRHLRQKNSTAQPKPGFPKSDYWADVADSVRTRAAGRTAAVEISKEGAALHYYGGTVHPKNGHRALAIPANPAAAGVWPSEKGRADFALVWPKGETTGTIRKKDTGDVWWFLVGSATIRADKGVLPREPDVARSATDAMEAAIQ